MSLFGKKKEEKQVPTCCGESAATETAETSCCCGSAETSQPVAETSCCCGEKVDGICCIKVLGAGCKSCHDQYEEAKKAVASMGLGIEVEYITDLEKVMAYGVMSMPAIVVNDKVMTMGKVLKAKDVEKLLQSV